MSDLVARYIERHAEPVARAACPVSRSYRHCLVIPAYDEAPGIAERVLPATARDVLVILVVNAPDSAPEAARTRTLALLPRPGSAQQVTTLDRQRQLDVLTIDAVTQPLPAARSTGLARKLGTDLACSLWLDGRVQGGLIGHTDADTALPSNYFAQLESADNFAVQAALLPFRHESADAMLAAAGNAYELYLRVHAQALDQAGAPYGLPVLGSAIAVHPKAYAQVRGTPVRAAAEDFYLMNKLAKLTRIHYLTGTPVRPQARLSGRVPFGTGPALKRLLEHRRPELSQLQYGAASYELLRQFYQGLRQLEAARADPQLWRDPDLAWLLKRLGFASLLDRLRKQHRSRRLLQRAVHEWFDGQKIVRFLNAARHFHPDTAVLPRLQQLRGAPGAAAGVLCDALEAERRASVHGIEVKLPAEANAGAGGPANQFTN